MIYIHVPFCRTFCLYCDFYSEIPPKDDGGDFREYASRVCAELYARRDEIKRTSTVHTLYIGGGTPSVLPLSCLKSIVEACREVDGGSWDEFTVELNPDDVTPTLLEGLGELGVNRLSMGVQSLDDCALKWMRRRHDARGAENAYRMSREAGFKNVSLDLIFGIDGFGISESLEKIVSLGPEHISAYQLSIEEGSALGEMVKSGKYTEAPEEICRAQYEQICSRLKEAGYVHYEISNWAKPGFQARHNSAYWDRSPYVGIGPGAHSLEIGESQRRSWNSTDLCWWGKPREFETLSRKEIEEERLMLGLRRAEGIDGKKIEEKDWFVADSIISDLLVNSQL